MLNPENCFEYHGWVIPLYLESMGSLFHKCEDGELGLPGVQVHSEETRFTAFTATCLHCKTKMPPEDSKVLMAMWNLNKRIS